MNIKMLILLLEFKHLYIKLVEENFEEIINLDKNKLTDLEKQLIEILEEYDYIIDL